MSLRKRRHKQPPVSCQNAKRQTDAMYAEIITIHNVLFTTIFFTYILIICQTVNKMSWKRSRYK